jgi:hypothetical protein
MVHGAFIFCSTEEKEMNKEFDFDKLAIAWEAPIVSRSEVGKFSGGVLHPRTMANNDCLGNSPGKIIIGRRVCYDKWTLVEWMKKRQGGEASND